MNLHVSEIPKNICKEIIINFHYSGRCPGIKFCYGLFNGTTIVGCIIFSIPASYTLCNGVCGKEYRSFVLELSRLVILTKQKNAASFLIGEALRKLPEAILVSYADCNDHVSHVGYVYQATNWLYTGHGNAEPIWLHPATKEVISYTRRHIDDKAKKVGLSHTDLIKKKQLGKHRYINFSGNRQFKKKAIKALKYKILPYPKGITKRHDCNVMKTVLSV